VTGTLTAHHVDTYDDPTRYHTHHCHSTATNASTTTSAATPAPITSLA